MINNIWNHPKTTIAGLLLAVATVAGVLTTQGVTLGHAGTGTVVALVSGIATALLGLLAKDPGSNGSSSGSGGATAGVLVLCLLLAPLALGTQGCTSAQVNTAVSEINTYLPVAISLLNEALTIFGAVGVQPQAAVGGSSVAGVLQTINTDLAALQKPLSDYLQATSSSGKNSAWANIQAAMDTAVADTDNLLLIAKVSDPKSQQAGTIIISSLDAAVHVLDAYMSGAQSQQVVAAKVAKRAVKLNQVSQYWSQHDRQQISAALGVPYPVAYDYAVAHGF